MLVAILVLVVVLIVIGICYRDYTIKKQQSTVVNYDRGLVRKAAEYSIDASNTTNPLEAMSKINCAIQIIESLHYRYGPDAAAARVSENTEALLRSFFSQKDSIHREISRVYDDIVPAHPLNRVVGFDDGNSVEEEEDEDEEEEATV